MNVLPDLAYEFGRKHEERNDAVAARDAYRNAINSADPHWAPLAASRLANLLRAAGGPSEEMDAAYQVAIDSGNPEVAPQAAFNLASVLVERGDLAAAEATYRRAAAFGSPPEVVACANHYVGYLRHRQGDTPGALTAYAAAAAVGSVDLSFSTLLSVPALLNTNGDPAGATALAGAAIESWPPGPALVATYDLARILTTAGDLASAAEACVRLADTGDQAWVATVRGLRSHERGAAAAAREALQEVLDSTNAEAKALVAHAIAQIQYARATRLFQEVDWAALQHAHGVATNVPKMAAQLITADAQQQAAAVTFLNSSLLHQQSTIFTATAPAALIVMAALLHHNTDTTYHAPNTKPQPLRVVLLDWLLGVARNATAADHTAARACTALFPELHTAVAALRATDPDPAIAHAADAAIAALRPR